MHQIDWRQFVEDRGCWCVLHPHIVSIRKLFVVRSQSQKFAHTVTCPSSKKSVGGWRLGSGTVIKVLSTFYLLLTPSLDSHHRRTGGSLSLFEMAVPNGAGIHALNIATRPLILSLGQIRVGFLFVAMLNLKLIFDRSRYPYPQNLTNGLLLKSFGMSSPMNNHCWKT